jgi:urease accessory protein
MKRIATDDPFPVASHTPWQASLALGFADDGGTTRMVERTHSGPLRVQKPLYPEGEKICHAIIVHPPGGVVGGDELTITTNVHDNAHAFLTTPGAAKWYKANGKVSHQHVHLHIADNATLEWLPQETIFFDTAHVRLENTVTLGKNASYIGWEMLCFGRTASGETFNSGRIEQRTSIRREGKLVWFEQGTLSPEDGSMTNALSLAGKTVCATLIAVGKQLPASVISALREEQQGMFGVTQMKSVLVVRYLGESSEIARQVMQRAWALIRPALIGKEAVVPRIWNT